MHLINKRHLEKETTPGVIVSEPNIPYGRETIFVNDKPDADDHYRLAHHQDFVKSPQVMEGRIV